MRPVQTVETWDEEADFVIVGFGLAGAAAAVEAHDIDPEAKVVVLEKMPETLAGGNSIASGQTFIVPSENGVDMPRGRVSEEAITAATTDYDLPEGVPVFQTCP